MTDIDIEYDSPLESKHSLKCFIGHDDEITISEGNISELPPLPLDRFMFQITNDNNENRQQSKSSGSVYRHIEDDSPQAANNGGDTVRHIRVSQFPVSEEISLLPPGVAEEIENERKLSKRLSLNAAPGGSVALAPPKRGRSVRYSQSYEECTFDPTKTFGGDEAKRGWGTIRRTLTDENKQKRTTLFELIAKETMEECEEKRGILLSSGDFPTISRKSIFSGNKTSIYVPGQPGMAALVRLSTKTARGSCAPNLQTIFGGMMDETGAFQASESSKQLPSPVGKKHSPWRNQTDQEKVGVNVPYRRALSIKDLCKMAERQEYVNAEIPSPLEKHGNEKYTLDFNRPVMDILNLEKEHQLSQAKDADINLLKTFFTETGTRREADSKLVTSLGARHGEHLNTDKIMKTRTSFSSRWIAVKNAMFKDKKFRDSQKGKHEIIPTDPNHHGVRVMNLGRFFFPVEHYMDVITIVEVEQYLTQTDIFVTIPKPVVHDVEKSFSGFLTMGEKKFLQYLFGWFNDRITPEVGSRDLMRRSTYFYFLSRVKLVMLPMRRNLKTLMGMTWLQDHELEAIKDFKLGMKSMSYAAVADIFENFSNNQILTQMEFMNSVTFIVLTLYQDPASARHFLFNNHISSASRKGLAPAVQIHNAGDSVPTSPKGELRFQYDWIESSIFEQLFEPASLLFVEEYKDVFKEFFLNYAVQADVFQETEQKTTLQHFFEKIQEPAVGEIKPAGRRSAGPRKSLESVKSQLFNDVRDVRQSSKRSTVSNNGLSPGGPNGPMKVRPPTEKNIKKIEKNGPPQKGGRKISVLAVVANLKKKLSHKEFRRGGINIESHTPDHSVKSGATGDKAGTPIYFPLHSGAKIAAHLHSAEENAAQSYLFALYGSINETVMRWEECDIFLSNFGFFQKNIISRHAAWKIFKEANLRHNPDSILFFGFIEVLMKCCLHYLNFFGNEVQETSSSRGKCFWIIAFLRKMHKDALSNYAEYHIKQKQKKLKYVDRRVREIKKPPPYHIWNLEKKNLQLDNLYRDDHCFSKLLISDYKI